MNWKGLEKNDFYDDVHTGINGSVKISKILYPHLKNILIDLMKFILT